MITGMPRIAIAVNDFPATVATFRDRFAMPVVDLSATSVDSLGAELAMCTPSGGSNIEIMAPANPASPLSQSLQRFLDRRGEGLFALMLEAPDPDAEADELAGRGLNVLPLMAGAGGRDVHPNSTHGVLIRIYPVDSFKRPDAAADPPDAGTAGLSGIARVIVAVNDLDHAATVYGYGLALGTHSPTVDAARGVRSVLCQPPAGGTIELVAVEDSSRPFAHAIKTFLAGGREGMYALVLQAADLQACASALGTRGLDVGAAADSEQVLEIDRRATAGALFRVETRSPSGDAA